METIKTLKRHVKVTFIEPVLGTWPSNENTAANRTALPQEAMQLRGQALRSIGIE